MVFVDDLLNFTPGNFIQLNINGESVEVEATPDMPLLWVLLDTLGMTGTKFGCGMAMCGACTMLHVDGVATRSCVTPAAASGGKKITTIEGLPPNGDHPLQKAWVAEGVPQCGYCQSGQIVRCGVAQNKPQAQTQPN